MKRIGIFLLFLPLAMPLAGLFGIMHDEISYSVSTEYFTKFKFIEFRLLDTNLPDHFRTGEVGFLASWWMGIPLGILCGLPGFLQRSPSLMLRALIWSLPVIATFTLAIALAGLAYGWSRTQTIDLASYRDWFIPP
jgi:ABC-type proline/glycine betaine transport system permease subunit